MRARSFVVPFAFAVLITLTGVIGFDPVSPGVFAQGNAGCGRARWAWAGRCAGDRGAGRRQVADAARRP